MCAAGGATPRVISAGTTVGTATRYVAVIGNERPSTQSTRAETMSVATRFPKPRARMRLEILSPRPVWRRIPTAMPATAVVAPMGRTCFVPAAIAFTSLVGLSEVSRLMYETRIATTIDQNTAVIVENPAMRKTMIAKSDVYWYQ